MKKLINLFIFLALICFGILTHATEYTTEEINQFYNKLLSGLVRDRYLPETVSEKQDLIIERIQNSTFMNELKEKTYPCFSKIQGLTDLKTVKRIEVQNCLSPILYELDKKIWISIAEVEMGKKIDKNDPVQEIEAMRMGSKIVDNNSRSRESEILDKALNFQEKNSFPTDDKMGQNVSNKLKEIQNNPTHNMDLTNQNDSVSTTASDEIIYLKDLRIDLHAQRLLIDIKRHSYSCSTNSDGIKQVITDKLEKPTCGVDLICQKDGSILVNFKNECISNTNSDIPMEDVIKAAIQKENRELYTFTCQEHSCIWKKNY